MQFQRNGVTVSVDDEEMRRLVLERLNGDSPDVCIHMGMMGSLSEAPRIGAEWHSQGGIYAGIARGREGAADYHLIVGPEYEGQLEWPAAIDWAVKQGRRGFSDFCLPYRKEQALCFANVPELFKAEAYWSSEQHASNSDCAWVQSFGHGYQHDWGKNGKFRARAVRRLVIS